MPNHVNFEKMNLNNLPIGGHYLLARDGEYLDRENEIWRHSGYLKRTDSKVNVILIGPACKASLRQKILKAAEDDFFSTGFSVNATGTVRIDGVAVHYAAIKPGIKLAREVTSWAPPKKKPVPLALAIVAIGCFIFILLGTIIALSKFLPPEPQEIVFFSDSYNSDNETSKLWKQEAGKWYVIDGIYTCSTDDSRCLSLSKQVKTRSFTIDVDVFGKEGADKSIYFGVTGQNSYRVSLQSDPINQLVLTKTTENQSNIVLSQVEFDNSIQTWYHITVKVEEGLIEVYINNDLVLSLEDSSIKDVDGLIGLGVESIKNGASDINSAEFDNFQISTDEE